MELYDALASNTEATRLDAAKELVKKILEGNKTGNAEKGAELTYALNRLVKGLTSGRESARIGFSIALTELLSELPDVDVEQLLQSIETHTTPSGSISGMEERDFHFGKLFGYTTLIQSSVLFRPSAAPGAISSVIDNLIHLSLKKTWLREPAAKALFSLIPLLPQLKNGKTLAQEISNRLETKELAKTQDGAAVLMAMSSFPGSLKPTSKSWKNGDPLHRENKSLLFKVLGELPIEGESAHSSGTSKTRPHFIWTLIGPRYNEFAPNNVEFKELWNNVVEGFFGENASLERKFRGFQIFSMLLPEIHANFVPKLLTPNLLRCIVNHSYNVDRYLHKASKKALTTLLETCEQRPEVTLKVWHELSDYSTQFDRLSKSGIIEGLYPFIHRDSLPNFFNLSENAIVHRNKDRRWYADQQIIVLRQHLTMLLEHHRPRLMDYFDFLCEFGFFITDKDLSKEDRAMLREKLFSALSILIRDKSEVWPTVAVLKIESLEEDHKKDVKLDSQIKKIRKATIKSLKSLRKLRLKKESQQFRGLEMLFALAVLQLYNGDSEAVFILEELQSCYEMAINQSEGQSEILIEVILGLLSKPSALLRKLSGQVFESLVGDITSAGLKLLLDVLLTRETASGVNELFDNEADEEMDEEDDEDNEDEDEGEGEENEDEDEDEDEDEEDDEDDEEEEADEDEMDVDNGADEELNAALSAALGTTNEPNGNGVDGESEEEQLMNDDEMLALDDNLASIFRQRLKPNRAKEVKYTKLQMSTFKCKVIDLLEILIKSRNDLALEMILPLLEVLRITKDETVHSKTLELLRKLAKSKDLPEPTDNLMSLLRRIHDEAARTKGKDGNIHSQLGIYIARIARKGGQEDEVIGVYAETMRKWIKNGKSMVKAGLFADWVNWCQSIRR